MTTRNIVPQTAGEGGLGTEIKPWGRVFAGGIFSPAIRTRLSADTTYYVRADGNDNNDGLADTAAGAFATLQGALDYLARRIDGNGFNVTVSAGAGNFAGFGVNRPLVGINALTVQGAGEGTVLTSGVSASYCPQNVTAKNFAFNVGSGRCFAASQGAYLYITGTIKVVSAAAGIGAAYSCGRVYVRYAQINIAAPNILALAECYEYGEMRFTDSTVTYGAPVTLGQQSARCIAGQMFFGAVTFVNPEQATGKRFLAQNGGIIDTNGGGANYFPGTVAGTVLNGGIYG
jgi:hypothetical protein